MSINVLEDIMFFNDHIDSDKPNSISASTLLKPNYYAKMYLNRAEKQDGNIDIKFKRSSFMGTAFHERAAYITREKPEYMVEGYLEREIVIDEVTYTISGSFDGVKTIDGKHYLYDYKTGYGKERKQDVLDKDAMQMSIYRWLLEEAYPDIEIEDTAYSIFVSHNVNVMEEYPVLLKSTKFITEFIEAKVWTVNETTVADCNDSSTYNTCTYCDYICDERK